KKIGLLSLFAVSTFLLTTSCVSKKKYTASQAHVASLQEDSTRFENTIRELRTDLQRVESQYDKYRNMSEDERASLMAQVERQGSELSEKDQALQLRAQRLRALQDRLNQQQQIVDN